MFNPWFTAMLVALTTNIEEVADLRSSTQLYAFLSICLTGLHYIV